MWRAGDGDGVESIPVVRKGYDRGAVEAIVQGLRDEKRELMRLADEARAELESVRGQFEEERRQLKAALKDPERASQVVGREASEVLRSATEAANALRRKAEAAGAEILERARREASEIERRTRLNAQGELEEAKHEARQHLDQIRLQGQEILKMSDRTAATAVEAAKREGRSLVYRAREHASQLLAEAEAKATSLREEISQLELKRVALLQLLDAAGRLVEEALSVTADLVDGQPEADADREPAEKASAEEATLEREGEAADDEVRAESGLAEPGEHPLDLVDPPSGWDSFDEVRRLIEEVATAGEEEPLERLEPAAEPADAGASAEFSEDPPEVSGSVPEEVEGGPHASEALSQARLSRLEALFAELQGVSEPTQPDTDFRPGEAERAMPEQAQVAGEGAPGEIDGADDFSERDLPPSIAAKYHEKLDSAEGDFARRVKRLFQDDLNQVLSSIRAGGRDAAETAVDALIADRSGRSEQVRDHLTRLFIGGVEFALAVADRNEEIDPHAYADQIEEEVMSFVGELAELALKPIRELLSANDESTESELVSSVSSFFREVRNQRLDGFAEDAARAAFSLGTRSLPGALGYRWVVGAGVLPCADCEDNVLGEVASTDEEFPTGHKRPPAHPGCRCFIIPVFV